MIVYYWFCAAIIGGMILGEGLLSSSDSCNSWIWKYNSCFLNFLSDEAPGLLPFPISTLFLCDIESVQPYKILGCALLWKRKTADAFVPSTET